MQIFRISQCFVSMRADDYISLIKSTILIISTLGQGIVFNGLKCFSFVRYPIVQWSAH